jgi:hypothetical protein
MDTNVEWPTRNSVGLLAPAASAGRYRRPPPGMGWYSDNSTLSFTIIRQSLRSLRQNDCSGFGVFVLTKTLRGRAGNPTSTSDIVATTNVDDTSAAELGALDQ